MLPPFVQWIPSTGRWEDLPGRDASIAMTMSLLAGRWSGSTKVWYRMTNWFCVAPFLGSDGGGRAVLGGEVRFFDGFKCVGLQFRQQLSIHSPRTFKSRFKASEWILGWKVAKIPVFPKNQIFDPCFNFSENLNLFMCYFTRFLDDLEPFKPWFSCRSLVMSQLKMFGGPHWPLKAGWWS